MDTENNMYCAVSKVHFTSSIVSKDNGNRHLTIKNVLLRDFRLLPWRSSGLPSSGLLRSVRLLVNSKS